MMMTELRVATTLNLSPLGARRLARRWKKAFRRRKMDDVSPTWARAQLRKSSCPRRRRSLQKVVVENEKRDGRGSQDQGYEAPVGRRRWKAFHGLLIPSKGRRGPHPWIFQRIKGQMNNEMPSSIGAAKRFKSQPQ